MSDSYLRQRGRRSGGLVVWEDVGIAAATVVIAFASLDRQTAGERVIDAVAFGLGAAVLWQLVRWAGRFLFTVPREMHSEARADRDRALARVAELESRKPVTRVEWMEMASEFKQVQDLAVRADWSSGRDGESWRICGGMPVANRQTEVLCKRAGMMLIGSPRISAGLSQKVSSQADPVYRWLEYLRERGTAFSIRTFGQEYDETTGERHSFRGGLIENLPTVSAHACIECSADEI